VDGFGIWDFCSKPVMQAAFCSRKILNWNLSHLARKIFPGSGTERLDWIICNLRIQTGATCKRIFRSGFYPPPWEWCGRSWPIAAFYNIHPPWPGRTGTCLGMFHYTHKSLLTSPIYNNLGL
jgi:hypothetical protein